MNAHSFDHIAASPSTSATRRAIVRRLGGLALGAVGLVGLTQVAAAQNHNQNHNPHQNGQQECLNRCQGHHKNRCHSRCRRNR
jgi:hypothetical protein